MLPSFFKPVCTIWLQKVRQSTILNNHFLQLLWPGPSHYLHNTEQSFPTVTVAWTLSLFAQYWTIISYSYCRLDPLTICTILNNHFLQLLWPGLSHYLHNTEQSFLQLLWPGLSHYLHNTEQSFPTVTVAWATLLSAQYWTIISYSYCGRDFPAISQPKLLKWHSI